ncbi:MAG: hypothetical protein IJB86_00870 [Clostridia bacterium]|nr:hypothetical protein [Clostridia bacterium]
MIYEKDKIAGEVYSVNFSDFIPSAENIEPVTRITNFMTLGPFVAQTDAGFETEYFYHRNKVLDIDYLKSSGGECSITPYIGQKVKNDFYGEDYLRWIKGLIKWDALRFDGDENTDCDDAIFATEQKNCVFYAAVYIDCDKESRAVLCYNTSGCSTFLNGEMVDYLPYGRVKGIKSYGRLTPVTLRQGRNLLLFKLRTGYICDSFDLAIDNCMLLPVMCDCGDTAVTFPVRSGGYFGTKEEPRQIFNVFAASFADNDGFSLDCSAGGFSETLTADPASKGCVTVLRPSFPANGRKETVNFCLNYKNERKAYDFTVITDEYIGFDGKEFCFSDFHFDTTYHQDQKTYAMGALFITDEMVKRLKSDPNFKAVLSEVDYLHPYYSLFPDSRETLRNAFKEGRAEPDCFYNQPNDLTSSGEGFVRNMIYGQMYHRDVLGRICSVYNPCDVFGHFNQMSQVISKGGAQSARWSKLVWGLDRVVKHMSPDGTTLIHDKGLDKETAVRMNLDCCAESSGSNNKLPAYSQDGDTSWRENTLTKATDAVMSELANALISCDKENIEKSGRSTIGLTSRDLTQHHSGVLLTRTDFKQANRLGENLLISAEKFSVIASLLGAKYPDLALDKAWRQLLCGQHHDSITGTNNEVSFVDLMIEYREAVETASEIVDGAIGYICSHIDGGDADYAVFNPHTFERTDVCEINLPKDKAYNGAMKSSDGTVYPLSVIAETEDAVRCVFTPCIPALGYDCFSVISFVNEQINDESDYIENEFYKITVDKKRGGGIVSIFDKKNNRELVENGVDGPANRLVILKEDTHRCETQHELYTTGHKMFSSDYKATVKTVKNNTLQKLICKYKMETVADICQVITLYNNIDRIDFKTYVDDYIDRDDLFTVTFPINLKGVKPVFDDRFAPHVAGKSKNKLQYQTHQFFNYSHSRILPVNQWLDLGPTVTIRLKNGSFNIGMTSIIRKDDGSLIDVSDKLLSALTKKAVPVTQFCDETRVLGESTIHYNEDIRDCDTRFVLTVKGDGNLYAEKLLESVSEETKSAFNAASVGVLYLKDSDNLFEKEIDVILIQADSSKLLSDWVDEFSRQLESDRFADIPEAVTDEKMSVSDDYGVALLNNGNISCSVDGENLLNIMLFHTADFYGNIGKTTATAKGLIPENKSHCFTYSLCPHTLSYREAEIYKKAFSFNDPFISSELNDANGSLSQKNSFIECDGSFAVTSVRLGGYPLASLRNDFGSVNDRGVVIRGFETDGKDNTFTVRFPFNIVRTESLDLLDEAQKTMDCTGGNTFTQTVGSHSIETVRFTPEPIGNCNETTIVSECEKVQPVFVRSWEHNVGSMPVGYLSLVGSISRKIEKIDDCNFDLSVSVVNNKTDCSARGTAYLTVPCGFTSEMTKFPYDLEANEHVVYNFRITRENKEQNGIFRLRYEDNGQTFEDILEFGFFSPDVYLSINGNEISVEVTNPTEENLNGTLAVATPFETWEYGCHNRNAICGISPSCCSVNVEKGKTEKYIFRITKGTGEVTDTFWAVAKLMVNGRIFFSHDTNESVHHSCWTHHFYPDEVVSNGKSLRKLLEMN